MKRVSGPKRKFNKSKQTSKRVKNLEKKVHRIQTEDEVKWVDTFITATALSAAGANTLLNGISAGDTPSNIIGSEASATSLTMKFLIDGYAGVQIAPQLVRILVYWDQQSNQGNPLLAGNANTLSLLDNTTITDLTLAPYNMNNTDRYRIVYDKTFYMPMFGESPVGTSTLFSPGDSNNGLGFVAKKFKFNRKVQYTSVPNATSATINKNALWMSYMTNAAVDPYYLEAGLRFRYKDD